MHTDLKSKDGCKAQSSEEIKKQFSSGFVASLSPSEVWHFKLGLPSSEQMQHVSLPTLNKRIYNFVCQIFPMAKQHRLPFYLSESRPKKLFEILDVDIWGPHTDATHNGCKFFLTIVDDLFRATWVHSLSHKSNATPLLKSFIVFVEMHFDAKVKIMRSNNGMEFQSEPAKQFYNEKGIVIQSSYVNTG